MTSKRSSKSVSTESSAERELRKATSLLRRIIRPVLSYRSPICADEEAAPNQLVLDLCRRHPQLALERFPTHKDGVTLSPIKFLLQNKANLGVVRGFCEAFPRALEQSDQAHTDYFNLDGYPLHLACVARQEEGDLIALLARAYPEAARWKNQGGYLPLHLMLEYRGMTPALEGVQALVQLYPESTILKAPVYPPPVFSVFSLPHCRVELMECILAAVPRHVTSLQFPIGCFRDDTVSADHARALTRVLPQLHELELVPPQWHPDGWSLFANACRPTALVHLRTLVLKAPKYNPTAPNNQQQQQAALGTLLTNLTALPHLQSLHLQVDYHPQEIRNMTQALAQLLAHGPALRCLKVDGFPLELPAIFEVLKSNTRLQHLILNDLVAPPHQLSLSQVLQDHNVTLQKAATVSFTGQLGDEYSNIQYWARLNRLGRATARRATTSVGTIVQLLQAAGADDGLLQGSRVEHAAVPILYGLLRESPGTWSTTARTITRRSSGVAAAAAAASQPTGSSTIIMGDVEMQYDIAEEENKDDSALLSEISSITIRQGAFLSAMVNSLHSTLDCAAEPSVEAAVETVPSSTATASTQKAPPTTSAIPSPMKRPLVSSPSESSRKRKQPRPES